MGTITGVPARSYHGLLVAALRPPVDRTVLVAALEESVVTGDRVTPLGEPVAVVLTGRRPVFSYEAGGVRLHKTVWMAHGRNTTYVRYAVEAEAARSVTLRLVPLVTERDHHAVRRVADGVPSGPLRIISPGATVVHEGRWVRDVALAEETGRGLLDAQDLWAPLRVDVTVAPGAPFTLVLTAENSEPEPAEAALEAAELRDAELLASAAVRDPGSFVARSVLAADAFLVRRGVGGPTDARTVIAGYPWFNDWGRDTMISLPGLCLATGRGGRGGDDPAFVRAVRARRPDPQRLSRRPGARTCVSHDRCLALVRPGGRRLRGRHRRPGAAGGAAAHPAVDRGPPRRRDSLRDRGRSFGWAPAGWVGWRPADVDGREGGRLGRDAAARQAGRDPGALGRRAPIRRGMGRRAVVPGARRPRRDVVPGSVLASGSRLPAGRRGRPRRRRSVAAAQPGARAVAPLPARRADGGPLGARRDRPGAARAARPALARAVRSRVSTQLPG